MLREMVDRALFHRLDAFLVLLEDRLIAIDHEIEDRVGNIVRPFGQPFGVNLQPSHSFWCARVEPIRAVTMNLWPRKIAVWP